MAREPQPVGTWSTIWTKQIGPKKWEARTRFRDLTGKIRYPERVGTSKSAAANRLKKHLTESIAVDQGGKLTGATRFSELATVWLAGKTKVSSRTVRRYQSVVRLHLEPRMGELRLRECTTPRLTRKVHEIATEVGAPTALQARKILRQTFDMAVEQGALQHSPADKIPTVETQHKEVRILTPEERKLLREGMRRWEKGLPPMPPEPGEAEPKPKTLMGRYGVRDLADLTDVLFATGGRIGETLALRWSDVDFDAKRITLAGTIVWEETGQEKPRRKRVRQDFRKHGGEILELQMPQFAIDSLKARKARTQIANVHDAVFPSASGTWRDPDNLRAQWRKIRVELGLDWVTPHTLRKTVATVLDAEQGSKAAAQQLGHTDDAVTRKHYIEKRPVAGPDTQEILQRAITGDPEDSQAA